MRHQHGLTVGPAKVQANMRRVCALTWPIAAAVCSLVPLAYATPPDLTYLAGIWDNADDVILVTSSLGSTDMHKASDPTRPFIGILLSGPAEENLSSAALISLPSSRAPPAA